jgi:hypothetical protein
MEEDALLATHVVAEPAHRADIQASNRLLIVGRVCSVVAFGALVAAGVSHFETGKKSSKPTSASLSIPNEVKATTGGAPSDPVTTTGWYFYKAAYIVPNGSMPEAWDFMLDYSGGYDCAPVPLGCDGYKLTCDYGLTPYVADKQLHYVEMPKVFSHAVDGDSLGADGWNQIQTDNLAGLSKGKFSSQVHNKVEVVVGSLRAKMNQLKVGGYAGMQRYEMKDGKAISHYMVSVVGQVWDFVGVLESEDEAKELGFTSWEADECAVAHEIGSDVVGVSNIMRTNGNDTMSWWTGQQVAVSDADSPEMQTLFSHLKENQGATIKISSNDFCKVAKVTYVNDMEMSTGGDSDNTVELKFVQNFNHQKMAGPSDEHPDGLTVKDYEEYVGRVHSRYLSRPADGNSEDKWRGWDHFLDQHVGIKYARTDGCENQAQTVNKMRIDDDIPVGKRSVEGDGDHYYAGYPKIAMTMEFNTECYHGDGSTNICACMHANSDLLFLKEYDYKCMDNDDEF